MTSTQDASLGVLEESTYGTSAGAVTRWFEFLPDPDLKWEPERKQGLGLRVGARVARSARRVTTGVGGSGSFELEATSKGMGLLWKWALGANTSTLVSDATYQQVATLADAPAAFSLQQGLPQIGGTVDAMTFLGCMIAGWELSFDNEDILKVKFNLDVRDLSTAIGYAAPSYASAPNLFHFANATLTTGTLTAPTATTMGSGGTAVADVIGGSLTVDNNLSSVKVVGAAGKKSRPTVGLRTIAGKLDVDYDNTTFRDAFIADTPFNLVLTWTAGALGVGVETLQVIVPEIKFNGDLPQSNGTDRIKQSMSFTGLDNLTAAQPIWVCARTGDTAV